MDHYTTLGINKSASQDEIKKAYRKLASIHHPDKGGNEHEFKKVQEAYEVLSDQTKKAQYDAPSGMEFSFEVNHGFDDLFRSFRQQHSHRPPPKRSNFVVKVTLEQAYFGAEVSVNGDIVRIPSGVRTGNKLFHKTSLIEIDVIPHPKFKRSNDDLLVDIDISVFEAIHGMDAELRHINKKILKFKIPKFTQPGQIIRLAGKGMPNPEVNHKGDLLVRCNVFIPTLSEVELQSIPNIYNRKTLDI